VAIEPADLNRLANDLKIALPPPDPSPAPGVPVTARIIPELTTLAVSEDATSTIRLAGLAKNTTFKDAGFETFFDDLSPRLQDYDRRSRRNSRLLRLVLRRL
jgi:hypothetical protein